jgi:hypothetical protein
MDEVGNRQSMPFSLVGLSQLSLQEGNPEAAVKYANRRRMKPSRCKMPAPKQAPFARLGMLIWRFVCSRPRPQSSSALPPSQREWAGFSRLTPRPGGRASVCIEQGNSAGALGVIEGLLSHLVADGTIEGAEAPALVRLRC